MPPMEGFSRGVLIEAFIGNFMVQIWSARKDSVLSVDDPVEHTLGPVSGIFRENPPIGLGFHHICRKPRGFNLDSSGFR